MDIETFRQHCLAVKGATESLPFLHHNVLVFKIADKMFAMLTLEPKDGIFLANLKCAPERSVELRETYHGISPGHVPTTLLWNSVALDSDVPDDVIVGLIRHSVEEVLRAMPKAKRKAYLIANE